MQDWPCNPVASGKFTPAQRLLRKESFSHVLQAGFISDKYFKVFFLANGLPHARLGVVASKKVLPRAVDRNAVKRQVREAFRLHPLKQQPLDVVVMVRVAYRQLASSEREPLDRLFAKLISRVVESA